MLSSTRTILAWSLFALALALGPIEIIEVTSSSSIEPANHPSSTITKTSVSTVTSGVSTKTVYPPSSTTTKVSTSTLTSGVTTITVFPSSSTSIPVTSKSTTTTTPTSSGNGTSTPITTIVPPPFTFNSSTTSILHPTSVSYSNSTIIITTPITTPIPTTVVYTTTGEIVSYLSSVLSVETATLTSVTLIGTTTTAGSAQFTGAAVGLKVAGGEGRAVVGMVGFVAGVLALL